MRKLRSRGETKNYPWANRFMEVAIRSMKRVHLDQVIRSAGRPNSTTPTDPERLNVGLGVELADERLVCLEICKEFTFAGSSTGYWVNDDQSADVARGQRLWEMHAEFPYRRASGCVDLCVWRNVVNASGATEKYDNTEVFIEAKRAVRWTTSIEAAPTSERGQSQVSEVRADVEKLLSEMSARSQQDGKLVGHVLVWGTTADQNPSPAKFFEKLAHPQVEVYRSTWAPLATEARSANGASWDEAPPRIARWLWATLAEIHPAQAWWEG
jgi:hypothetical protein